VQDFIPVSKGTRGKKVAQKIRATSVLFKKEPKVNNLQKVGENSPNLVSLKAVRQNVVMSQRGI
jgi:hypothetical protein